MILRIDPDGPGDWTVVAVGETVLAVPDRARADDLAARLAGPDGFRAALERLVSGGISAAPDFALVDASGGIVRLVLRGAAEVVAGAEHVTGAGVTTWTERVLESVGELRLVVPGSSWTLVVGGAVPTASVPRPEAPRTLPARQDPPPVREDAPPHATLAPPGDDGDLPDDEPPADKLPVGDAEVGSEPYAFLFGDPASGASGDPDPLDADLDAELARADELEPDQPDQPDLPDESDQPDQPDDTATTARGPRLALELPDGIVEPLTAPLLVGRSPSDPGYDASGGVPRLVTVAAGDKDISRTHARIEVAGGAVVVTDLDSKNGTSVTLPGSAPRRLRAGEPSVVLPDTLIDLGGGVTMTVRETASEGVA